MRSYDFMKYKLFYFPTTHLILLGVFLFQQQITYHVPVLSANLSHSNFKYLAVIIKKKKLTIKHNNVLKITYYYILK